MDDTIKTTGTYQCVACNDIYDSSEIANPNVPTCRDPFCRANLKKISNLPKNDYEAATAMQR